MSNGEEIIISSKHMCEGRRKFIKNSVLAGSVLALPNVLFQRTSAAATATTSEGSSLTANMIWVAGSTPSLTTSVCAVFCKSFTLSTLPSQAIVNLFAYTRYRLYVNGVYQGRGPGRYQNTRPEYDSRDISAALQAGQNLITVLVYRDGCSASAPISRIMAHDGGFAAVIELTTGSALQTVVSDTSWLSAVDTSLVVHTNWSSIPETVDARLAFDYTNAALPTTGLAASVNVTGPSSGSPAFMTVWPRTIPLQTETLRSTTASTAFPATLSAGQNVVVTLPQIIQGYHVLVISAATAGSNLSVSYLLPDGTHSGQDVYTAKAGAQIKMGGDTFAMSSMVIVVNTGSVTFSQVQAVEVRYPFTLAASFNSSDAWLNHLWANCTRSMQLLSEDAYVDCADRERAEWIDCCPPGYDVTRVTMFGPALPGSTQPTWGDARLLKSLLRRFAASQQADGQIWASDCTNRADVHHIMSDRSCDWVVQLRNYYDATGDAAFVQEVWPVLMNLMNWFMLQKTSRGLVFAREWEVWDNPLRYEYCEGAGLNALVYRALEDGAYLGSAVGNNTDAGTLAANASQLSAAFNSVLWNSAAGSYSGAYISSSSYFDPAGLGTPLNLPVGNYQPTVQAALFALYSGIVPAGRIAPVSAFIQSHLSGVQVTMSYYYLFAFWYGLHGDRHDMNVLGQLRPQWNAQVIDAFQTSWESLFGDSKCHVYGSFPAFFLTAYVLGVRRVGAAADKTLLIEPRCSAVANVSGVAVTEFGPVPMAWTNNANGTVSIQCTVPAGLTTTLRLYPRQQSQAILIDGSTGTAALNAGFIEVALTAGTHTLQYPATSTQTNINLAGQANVYAVVTDGSPSGGGMGANGVAYSGSLLGAALPGAGVWFGLGSPGSANGVSSTTVTTPAGNFASLQFLAAAVNGAQLNQSFTVTYTDGTKSAFSQNMSDWGKSAGYPGESVALAMLYSLNAGGQKAAPCNLYAYSLSLNSTKTIQSITLPNNSNVTVLAMSLSAPPSPAAGLRFVPMTPYRIVDTRNGAGTFGGPALTAGGSRDFPIASSAAGIPTNAVAYSLNVTVVPPGPLAALSVYPTGAATSSTSLLSSDGRTRAHAAIVPGGTSGSVTLAASDTTHVIIDINGYFVPASTAAALAYYSIASTRVIDTRSNGFGAPSLTANSTRTFTIAGGVIPASAKAYALNITAVPKGPSKGNISVWPAGQAQPGTSTMNLPPSGTVTANTTITMAGTGGAVSVYAYDATDIIIDVMGYFAPAGTGGLSFYPIPATRVYDTGTINGGVSIAGTASVPVAGNTAAVPVTAQAYLVNATVVPTTGSLHYFTAWADGVTMPGTSLLNAYDGVPASSLAAVPSQNGMLDMYLTDGAQLTVDLYGYFAP